MFHIVYWWEHIALRQFISSPAINHGPKKPKRHIKTRTDLQAQKQKHQQDCFGVEGTIKPNEYIKNSSKNTILEERSSQKELDG